MPVSFNRRVIERGTCFSYGFHGLRNGLGASHNSKHTITPPPTAMLPRTNGFVSMCSSPGGGIPAPFFFFLHFPDLSAVTSSPADRLAVSFPQLTFTSPLLANTLTVSSVSAT